jgi:hypothetical protein
MTEYKAKSTDTLSFSLTQDNNPVGELTYDSWFTFKAKLELTDNKSFTVEPKGFWGTTIELKDSQNILLKFKMNWNGDIVIHTNFDNKEKDFIFKRRGVFNESFVLLDKEKNELLVVKSDFKWNKLKYDYVLTASDTFDNFDNQAILLLSIIHCANYFMAGMA